MQASLCLRAPQPSATLHCPRSTLQCQFRHRHRHHDNFLALHRTSTFSYGSLHANVRIQASSSTPASPLSEPSKRNETFASVAAATVITVALACSIGCICPNLSRRGRIGLAAPWYNILITSDADRGRPDHKRDIPSMEQQKQIRMQKRQQQQNANEVLLEMFESKEKRNQLPVQFYENTPNYHKLKEYFEDHLSLSDESLKTLNNQWKKIESGQVKIEIGLLLIDLCIIKGNVTEANEIGMVIIKIAPETNPRPKIRRAILNMIKDWDKKKEEEKKKEWKIFAKEMQHIDFSWMHEPEVD